MFEILDHPRVTWYFKIHLDSVTRGLTRGHRYLSGHLTTQSNSSILPPQKIAEAFILHQISLNGIQRLQVLKTPEKNHSK